jgi:hypothetical protein
LFAQVSTNAIIRRRADDRFRDICGLPADRQDGLYSRMKRLGIHPKRRGEAASV